MLRGQGWRLATWNVELLAASESNVRHGQLPAEGPVRPLVLLCFGAAKSRIWRLARIWSSFLPRQKARLSLSSMVFRCCEGKVWEACKLEFGASFLPCQKATLGTGSCPLVPWCFGAAKPRIWRLASRNVELIVMRKLFRQQQAVCNALRSC